MFCTEFSTARKLAYALKTISELEHSVHLTALPFNRFEPDSTRWWLSPSTENPAYKYGKIVVEESEPDLGSLFVGLYIEKGIGHTAAPAFSGTAYGRRSVMDETWLWHEFAEAITSGDFSSCLRDACSRADSQVVLAVEAMNVLPPSQDGWDIHAAELPRDLYLFAGTEERLEILEEGERSAGLLTHFTPCTSVRSLGEAVAQIEDLDWVWIDFLVGFRFRSTPEEEPESWNAEKIWEVAVTPWLPWVR